MFKRADGKPFRKQKIYNQGVGEEVSQGTHQRFIPKHMIGEIMPTNIYNESDSFVKNSYWNPIESNL